MLCHLLTMIAVHQLKVGDIDIVAALGDSLLVADGANSHNAPGILNECRGKAWGWEPTYTMSASSKLEIQF